ncbi:BMC domain-containing protein [Caminicella sporogenes DSM 14501]|uniref:BMC domain-containing protein n=1 Tax=Caminicella sporogenes DSM 14501 TaxID=1121266 RepID=A0A1M6S0I3_9FIRM|nr:BMC domain-containing protein [Caminicella sporogenes]RKD27156.1 hypothetical protein BET04_09575 [Caminicella sporogenes]SHK38231.1 BMC domain-containing protein [Caminicella sporogenes DSM 14501]
MFRKALGLLETYGYIGAVEAVDVCLKAADVKLIGLEFVRGGLVTVKICGEVSAVMTSIDAGAVAADRVGKVISVDVIERMGEGLEKIIYRPKRNKEINLRVQNEIDDGDKRGRKAETYIIDESKKSNSLKESEQFVIDYEGKLINIGDENELIRMKVVDLRKIARRVDGISIEKSRIKFAKKRELIKALTNAFRKEEE